MLSAAEGAAEAIYSVHNTRFKYGPSCRISDEFYGSLLDFVADVIRVDDAFVFELRSGGGLEDSCCHGMKLSPAVRRRLLASSIFYRMLSKAAKRGPFPVQDASRR